MAIASMVGVAGAARDEPQTAHLRGLIGNEVTGPHPPTGTSRSTTSEAPPPFPGRPNPSSVNRTLLLARTDDDGYMDVETVAAVPRGTTTPLKGAQRTL
jgi:hypothetical protein